jgi:hypothetical protein
VKTPDDARIQQDNDVMLRMNMVFSEEDRRAVGDFFGTEEIADRDLMRVFVKACIRKRLHELRGE